MKFNSVLEAIKHYAEISPDKICIRDFGGSICYKDYFEKIKSFAECLANRGVSKGQYVVVSASQTIDYLAAFHAVCLLGAIAVPLEKSVKAERAQLISNTVHAVLTVGIKTDGVENVSYKELCCFEPSGSFSFKLPNGDSVAEVLFTTGTTGKSKGVVMTHSADVAVAENVKYGVEMKENNNEIIPMPLNHAFALRRYYGNIINGSSVILMDGVIFVAKVFEAFSKYGATAVALAPSALSIILKLSGDKLGEFCDKIDYIELGSAHLPETEKQTLLKLLPNSRLYNFYGSSEAGCSCILNFNSDDDIPNCIGRPTVNSVIEFAENGNIVKTSSDSPARIISSGGMLMKGYFGDDVLTAETVIDGFVYSNDLGYKDELGRIFMLGRADDVIQSGGNKISPNDVEDVCLKYGGIEECAIIGVHDEVMGEIPYLFAVVNSSYLESDFIEFISKRLEGFMLPKKIILKECLPKSYNGKVLRRVLKEEALEY